MDEASPVASPKAAKPRGAPNAVVKPRRTTWHPRAEGPEEHDTLRLLWETWLEKKSRLFDGFWWGIVGLNGLQQDEQTENATVSPSAAKLGSRLVFCPAGSSNKAVQTQSWPMETSTCENEVE